MSARVWQSLKHSFRALRHRNFRLFFFGQSISLIGTWMQQIAMSWLIYRLTGSALLLGTLVFASQIPTFLISPFAGVLIDRWDRRKLLRLTQITSMIIATLLALLTLPGFVRVWHLMVLSILGGVVAAFDITGRQSFLVEMVETKIDLGNAIALNSLIFNVARLLGPSIGGVLIAEAGEGLCFLINAISYLPVVISLNLIRVKLRGKRRVNAYIWQELKEGVQYTFGFMPIRYILVLLAAISLMGLSYIVLMPVFVKEVLLGGPRGLGFLMASAGVGAVAATLMVAFRTKMIKLGMLIPASSALFGLALMGLAFSKNLLLAAWVLAIAGFGILVHMTACNTVLQTIVEDDKRGRVMSFYTMAFMGMAPLGSLIAGALASQWGVPLVLILGGGLCIMVSIIFTWRIPVLKKMVEPIYARWHKDLKVETVENSLIGP